MRCTSIREQPNGLAKGDLTHWFGQICGLDLRPGFFKNLSHTHDITVRFGEQEDNAWPFKCGTGHTNIGAIFRSGAALGFDAVLLSPRCADPFYRRSLKVAMGAVFSVPWTRLTRWHDALPDLAERGFTTVALTLADDAVPIEDAVAGVDRIALVLGSEGHGLSEHWERGAERRATIPMRAGIDSLNVAAASAVACYVAARR